MSARPRSAGQPSDRPPTLAPDFLPAVALALSLLPFLASVSLPAGARPSEDRPLLEDVTAASGLSFSHDNGERPVEPGEPPPLYLGAIMGSGVALFDYDRDGDLDVYLLQGEPLTSSPVAAASSRGQSQPGQDRLYRNDLIAGGPGMAGVPGRDWAAARLVDVTESAGIPAGGYGMGVAVGDVDADGWPDLYLARLGENRLLRNRGDGSFEDITGASPGLEDRRWSNGATFLDFDGDGALDLYVVNYVDFSPARNKLCPSPTGAPDYCGPSAFPPLPDRIFRNRGDGTFEEISATASIQKEPASGLGVVSGDFNGDGRPDLYVANDGMANQLFLNQGDGTFRDEALLGGAAVSALGVREASMGIAVGDADGNGHEDLFLTHLRNETNTLYLGDGRGLFRDATEETGLGTPSFPSTGFGTGFFDLDNDGDLDLFAGNGHVTLFAARQERGRAPASARQRGLPSADLGQRDQLFRNRGDGSFEEISVGEAGEAFEERLATRGVALGDLDLDGDTDLLLTHNGGPARLLRNRAADGAGWVSVRVLATGGADAVGTRIELLQNESPSQVRWARTDGSYASASDPAVRLGLGIASSAGSEAGRLLTLRITAPDQRQRVLRSVPAGHLLVWRLP